MRFLVDAQLPPALARMLADRGHFAEHVADVGAVNASDREIWQFALERDAVIITKDEDFADILRRSGPAPAVVWIRRGNTTRRALLEWFDPMVDQIVSVLTAGNRLVEVR